MKKYPNQLSLFETVEVDREQYPWLPFFPDFMPEVGGTAQMKPLILEGYGYCYMDRVRINEMVGNNVTCTVEHFSDNSYFKNGTVYKCTIQDLRPVTYEPHR